MINQKMKKWLESQVEVLKKLIFDSFGRNLNIYLKYRAAIIFDLIFRAQAIPNLEEIQEFIEYLKYLLNDPDSLSCQNSKEALKCVVQNACQQLCEKGECPTLKNKIKQCQISNNNKQQQQIMFEQIALKQCKGKQTLEQDLQENYDKS